MKQLSERTKKMCELIYGKTADTYDEMFALALERLDSSMNEQKKTN
jgi:hypothetical protein